MRVAVVFIFFIVLFISECSGQTFTCGVYIKDGKTLESNMQITIEDSTVLFNSPEDATYKLTFDRVPSSTGIYYTDGKFTSQLVLARETGKIMDFNYNRQISIIHELKPHYKAPLVYYCWRMPE